MMSEEVRFSECLHIADNISKLQTSPHHRQRQQEKIGIQIAVSVGRAKIEKRRSVDNSSVLKNLEIIAKDEDSSFLK